MDIVRIPVTPHVFTYLQVQHGPHIFVSDRNPASLLIRAMLKKFDKKEPWKVKPSQKLNLGAHYDIVIGKDGHKRLGGYISNEDIEKFSDTMDLLIRQEMYRWCNHPNATDHVIDFNIRRFQDLYGFTEDDLPFDNLKRWYYRERERMNKRLQCPVEVVPQMVIAY